jgi:hypothetical protein
VFIQPNGSVDVASAEGGDRFNPRPVHAWRWKPMHARMRSLSGVSVFAQLNPAQLVGHDSESMYLRQLYLVGLEQSAATGAFQELVRRRSSSSESSDH